MKDLVRRLRGALGIGLTWASLWVLLGSLFFLFIVNVRPEDIGPGEGLTEALPILALAGFLSGLGFAGVFSITERRRGGRELSVARGALWGLIGGIAIPLLMGTDGSMAWMTGLLGALFAAISVAIARRGALREVASGVDDGVG